VRHRDTQYYSFMGYTTIIYIYKCYIIELCVGIIRGNNKE